MSKRIVVDAGFGYKPMADVVIETGRNFTVDISDKWASIIASTNIDQILNNIEPEALAVLKKVRSGNGIKASVIRKAIRIVGSWYGMSSSRYCDVFGKQVHCYSLLKIEYATGEKLLRNPDPNPRIYVHTGVASGIRHSKIGKGGGTLVAKLPFTGNSKKDVWDSIYHVGLSHSGINKCRAFKGVLLREWYKLADKHENYYRDVAPNSPEFVASVVYAINLFTKAVQDSENVSARIKEWAAQLSVLQNERADFDHPRYKKSRDSISGIFGFISDITNSLALQVAAECKKNARAK